MLLGGSAFKAQFDGFLLGKSMVFGMWELKMEEQLIDFALKMLEDA